ncbi:hypothetical protein CEXT_55981 [Caerostris extrusa]|uniref:Uncharacterized protein n=1 Tax=Caerostris extrusa TaxID=172846 RepID=A0AAV4M5V7_CAEEX|nr:hypothetical protein CEXT_55981 [Caerostris extrusa]
MKLPICIQHLLGSIRRSKKDFRSGVSFIPRLDDAKFAEKSTDVNAAVLREFYKRREKTRKRKRQPSPKHLVSKKTQTSNLPPWMHSSKPKEL